MPGTSFADFPTGASLLVAGTHPCYYFVGFLLFLLALATTRRSTEHDGPRKAPQHSAVTEFALVMGSPALVFADELSRETIGFGQALGRAWSLQCLAGTISSID